MSTFSWRVLRLPLLITLLWGLLLFTLFRWTAQREDEYTTGLARIQTATLFSSIVDTRDWNANNGGVWVREHPGCPANPWLPEEERTLRAEGGTTLVKVNPAYMTRQIAESFTSTLASFRISSLSPKRPENRADQWETGALLSFEKDRHELFDLVSDKEGMVTAIWPPCPPRKAASSAIRTRRSATCSAASAYPSPPSPFLQRRPNASAPPGSHSGSSGSSAWWGSAGPRSRSTARRSLPKPPTAPRAPSSPT
ncbi:MAG: DUF3365 domain-containing protein [Bilophila wadsworthia]